MGYLLSKPITEKSQMCGETEWFRYACTSMQGWRSNQEDAYSCLPDYASTIATTNYADSSSGGVVKEVDREDGRSPTAASIKKMPEKEASSWATEEEEEKPGGVGLSLELSKSPPPPQNPAIPQKCSFFAVYDGHSGGEVAGYAAAELPAFLLNKGGLLEAVSITLNTKSTSAQEGLLLEPVRTALEKGFIAFDAALRQPEVIEKMRALHCKGPAATAAAIAAESNAANEKKKVAVVEKKGETNPAQNTEEKEGLSCSSGRGRGSDNKNSSAAAGNRKKKNGGGNKEELPGFDSGTTACVALLLGGGNSERRALVVANVGDCRAVLAYRDDGKAVELSVDHKPSDEVEQQRISKAHGYVFQGRVKGGLNLSRAFGDHSYKQAEKLPLEEQMITAFPDVIVHDLQSSTSPATSVVASAAGEGGSGNGKEGEMRNNGCPLLVLASDGIWGVMSSQQVVDFIFERLATKSLSEIGAELCDHCLAPNRYRNVGTDNMTVIIVDFSLTACGKTMPSHVELQGESSNDVVKKGKQAEGEHSASSSSHASPKRASKSSTGNPRASNEPTPSATTQGPKSKRRRGKTNGKSSEEQSSGEKTVEQAIDAR